MVTWEHERLLQHHDIVVVWENIFVPQGQC